jgi:hypothetical protein
MGITTWCPHNRRNNFSQSAKSIVYLAAVLAI